MGKFSVEYFFSGRHRFPEAVEPFPDSLAEVSFSWPGILPAPVSGDLDFLRRELVSDLKWCRAHGLSLDLALTAVCYGPDASTAVQRREVLDLIDLLSGHGLRPDTVTTTSPYLARIIKRFRPGIGVRAPFGMRLNHLISFEYLADCYDAFFVGGDVQRDLDAMRRFSAWCRENGKKLCMLANSGCLRNCPWRTFHGTLESHGPEAARRDAVSTGFSPVLCEKIFDDAQMVEFLRGSWIRPEDIGWYEPHVDMVALATSGSPDPSAIVAAYVSGRFEGDLFHLLVPGFHGRPRPVLLENSAFPDDWAESGIAGRCAVNCVHCGRCETVLARISRTNPAAANRSV
ncbi:MAG: hypothetical protein AB7F40_10600 [Victivallaceae bacterium]|nr:hypothetical protein [Victivallaceae bacterium]